METAGAIRYTIVMGIAEETVAITSDHHSIYPVPLGRPTFAYHNLRGKYYQNVKEQESLASAKVSARHVIVTLVLSCTVSEIRRLIG